jgi:hypothetical protein
MSVTQRGHERCHTKIEFSLVERVGQVLLHLLDSFEKIVLRIRIEEVGMEFVEDPDERVNVGYSLPTAHAHDL